MEHQYSIYLDTQIAIEARAEETKRRAQQAEQEFRDKQRQTAQEFWDKQQAVAQAAQIEARRGLEVRKSWAIRDVHVRSMGLKCSPFFFTDAPAYVDMKLEVTNGSKEALSSTSIGLAFVPLNGECPSSYAEKHTLDVKVSPGETRGAKIELIDGALSTRRVCIKVLDVEFAQ